MSKSEIDTILLLDLKRKAEAGIYYGREPGPYFSSCMGLDPRTGTRLIYTRDEGMHSSGWFKNPDYERCYHLSLSYFDPLTYEARPKDRKLTRIWLNGFFGQNVNLLWCEPPATNEGVMKDVWHYRLFCNPAWQPIKPRGEVYSREFTEKGWKSFSEVIYGEKEQRRKERERFLNR